MLFPGVQRPLVMGPLKSQFGDPLHVRTSGKTIWVYLPRRCVGVIVHRERMTRQIVRWMALNLVAVTRVA